MKSMPDHSRAMASHQRVFVRQVHVQHRRQLHRPAAMINETSPYLLQHAHNPVDWFPWGPDALARAKLLDRPIFLSIGYAACHWCHVMERESFEDEATAAYLNAGSSRSRSTARSGRTSTRSTWAPSRR